MPDDKCTNTQVFLEESIFSDGADLLQIRGSEKRKYHLPLVKNHELVTACFHEFPFLNFLTNHIVLTIKTKIKQDSFWWFNNSWKFDSALEIRETTWWAAHTESQFAESEIMMI